MSKNRKDVTKEPWPRWFQNTKMRYGDIAKCVKSIFEILIIVAGAVIAIYTLTYVHAELQNSIKQTDAIMQSNRPFLTIDPINAARDIRGFSGKIITPTGEEQSDPSKHFEVYLTVLNIGKAEALIDTISYYMITNNQYLIQRNPLERLPLTPGQPTVFTPHLKFQKGRKDFMRIRIAYRWEQQAISKEKYTMDRIYGFKYNESARSWSVGFVPLSDWNAKVSDKEPFIIE